MVERRSEHGIILLTLGSYHSRLELLKGDSRVAISVQFLKDVLHLSRACCLTEKLSDRGERELVLHRERLVTTFVLSSEQVLVLFSALTELILVLLRRGNESYHNLLHDAGLA